MKELSEFLVEANEHGYSSGNTGVKEDDESTTILYPPEGDIEGWRFKDHFYGGEPYGGQEVILRGGKPYWTMVYYGNMVPGQDLSIAYPFLQKALQNPHWELPVRGPRGYRVGNLKYSNSWEGTLEKFSGHEEITSGEKIIYQARYMGGLVDQVQE